MLRLGEAVEGEAVLMQVTSADKFRPCPPPLSSPSVRGRPIPKTFPDGLSRLCSRSVELLTQCQANYDGVSRVMALVGGG